MQARARAFADRVEPGDRRAAVQVGGHPAHHVVRGGRDRHELALGVDPGTAQGADDVGEQGGVDVAHIEADRGRARGVDPALDGAGDLVARGELVDEALAGAVEQPGALAADRLGDEEPVGAVGGGHHGGVKLHHLQVGQPRAGLVGEQQPGADRAGRIGGARPQRGGAAGRQHDRSGGEHGAVVEADRDRAILRGVDPRRAPALDDRDPRVLGRERRELADDPASGGRPASVHDPARRVAALQAQGEPAAAVGVEADAERRQRLDRRRGLVAQHPGG